MNLESLRNQLLAAARSQPPSDRVPYAFEQRILARLRAQPVPDLGALWTRMLWRAAAPCVAIALTIGVWVSVGGVTTPAPSETSEAEFAQVFEQTMLAGVAEQAEELW